MTMQVFEIKRQFVMRELSRAVAAAHEVVERLEYRYCEDGEETVTIRCANGYSKAVCVTADSLHAVMVDVLRALEDM
nr:MAG TPA: hypothetical protein [Caudoviricetes sp.]